MLRIEVAVSNYLMGVMGYDLSNYVRLLANHQIDKRVIITRNQNHTKTVQQTLLLVFVY
jgi:hypothetical protein